MAARSASYICNELNAPSANHEHEAFIDGLPARAVREGDAREVKQMEELQLYKWTRVDDLPQDAKLIKTGWVRRWKGTTVRSRLVLKDFALTIRDDLYAPTPQPMSIRAVLLYAALQDYKVETGDLACAFMQADTSQRKFAEPPQELRVPGWCWELLVCTGDKGPRGVGPQEIWALEIHFQSTDRYLVNFIPRAQRHHHCVKFTSV